ncbi:Protein DJ-1 D, partial [Physocladia obscura]
MTTGDAPKILMIVGDFSEDYEVMVPYQALEAFGFQVDTVCPGKKKGDTVATSVHDFVGFQTYAESRGHNFGITKDFDQVVLAEYAGLYVP